MFRRVLRVTIKLGLIAAVGVGIAVVVKKLTAPPADSSSLEPWPPLKTDSSRSDEDASSNGDSANTESAEVSS